MEEYLRERSKVNVTPKAAIEPIVKAEVKRHYNHGATIDAIVERMKEHTALDREAIEKIIAEMSAKERLKPRFVDGIETSYRSITGEKGTFDFYHAFSLPIGLLMKKEYAPGRIAKRITDTTELWKALHDEDNIRIEKQALADMMSLIPEDIEKQLEEQLEVQAEKRLRRQLSSFSAEEQIGLKEKYKKRLRECFLTLLPEEALPVSTGIEEAETIGCIADELCKRNKDER